MTNSPNRHNQPELRPKPRLLLLLLSRTGIALGVVLLAGLAGGAWWLWTFVQNDLAPLVQKNLSQTLKRPVQLGRLERFSLTGLRFGPTSLPATPTDPDHASVKAIDVTFNPLQFLFKRTLKLDITLIQPDAYIEQDKQGRWVRITPPTQQKPGPITINPDTVRLKNAKVVLVAYPKPGGRRVPFAIAQINGIGHLLNQNQQLISYELGGQPVTGGSFEIQGESRLKTNQTTLKLQGQNLLGSDLTHLVKVPLEVLSGRVDGNLTVQLNPKQAQPSVFGTAGLKAVTAKFDRLPQPFIDTQGTLRFQGTQIGLQNVQASFGKIPLFANGVLDTQGNYNITARVPAVSLANLQDTLKVKPPLPATGEFKADLAVRGPILNPILLGTFANIKPIRVDRVDFSAIQSQFAFSTATSSITLKDFQAIPAAGGKITGGGTIGLQKSGAGLNVVAQNLPGDAIARLYGISPQIHIGTVQALTQVSGSLGHLQTVVNWQALQATYPVRGSLEVITAGRDTLLLRDTVIDVAGGAVRVAGQLVKSRWQVSGTASGIQLGRLAQVPPALQAPVSGTFNLSGTTASFKPGAFSIQGSGSLNVAGGTVTASNIQVTGNQWQARGSVTSVQLGRILPQLPTQVQGTLDGKFNLSSSLTAFNLENLRGNAQGNLNVGGGTVTASNVQLGGGQWQASGTAGGIQLGRIIPQLTPQLQGTLSDGRFNLSGSLATITPQTVRGNASGSLQVAGGTVTANNVQLANGSWQGSFAANGVELGPLAQSALLSRFGKGGFTPAVQGRLSGNVNASGPLSGFNPAAIQASGQLSLLNLAAAGLNLDPVLSGNVNLAPGQGANLQLAGEKDRISLVLSPTYRPVSFLFQLGSALATGRTQGDTLQTRVSNFPVSILKAIAPLPAVVASQPVSGVLDADLAVNLNTYAVDGNLAIAKPAVASFAGDQFTAQFRYANGVGTLTRGELTQGQGVYALSATLAQSPNGPQFQGQIKIAQAQIQNVLSAVQSLDLQNLKRGPQSPTYGRAADVTTVPVGLPADASLLTQLRRFSEIEALLQQERLAQQQADPLSTFANLTGTFGGEISFKGSLKTGVAAEFDLKGSNWQWDKYKVNQVIAHGSFENGVLTLLPVGIESDQTLIAFNGQVGAKQQSGQLRVRNFPVDVLNNFVNLPVPFTGEVNATATVAGSLQNPRAVGALQLTNGTLNQKPITSALASFGYDNARLNFGSNVVVDSSNEPIQITGSVPYALPFASVKPNSDQISLDVNVQNQGLAVLNVLTNQVAWQGGQGQVQLQVRGTIKQPVPTGTITVKNATIAAQALPEPLTGVTGRVRFNGDRIQVESVQGNFSRGNVQAKGVIPIFANLKPNDPDQANPLSVALNQLTLNLKGLYQGGASGNVVITGSALSPVIGGDVTAARGKVLLTQQVAAAARAALSGAGTPNPGAATKQVAPAVGGIVPAFNNLRLTLGKAIAIILPPVLNFQATGGLTLNGTLNNLRPQGTIRLTGGDVNLFTTQFALARGYKQTVSFLPSQALDPNLHLRLIAVVPEVTQSPSQSTNSPLNFSSENSQNVDRRATDFGALQTVRVQAQITGPASKLLDNLELTSDPSRNKSDIYALLGGGFTQTVGSGNAALGVANLAGSALLGNFQQPITKVGNAIGLSELRIFPTLLNSYSNSRTTSSLGLVAEGDVDITGRLSGSILRVLTASSIPTQFGLSYQLSNRIRLRTLTDFSGDSRASVEYQDQF